MTGGKVRQNPYFVHYSPLPDLWEVWNKVKNDKGFMSGGKVQQYS